MFHPSKKPIGLSEDKINLKCIQYDNQSILSYLMLGESTCDDCQAHIIETQTLYFIFLDENHQVESEWMSVFSFIDVYCNSVRCMLILYKVGPIGYQGS